MEDQSKLVSKTNTITYAREPSDNNINNYSSTVNGKNITLIFQSNLVKNTIIANRSYRFTHENSTQKSYKLLKDGDVQVHCKFSSKNFQKKRNCFHRYWETHRIHINESEITSTKVCFS